MLSLPDCHRRVAGGMHTPKKIYPPQRSYPISAGACINDESRVQPLKSSSSSTVFLVFEYCWGLEPLEYIGVDVLIRECGAILEVEDCHHGLGLEYVPRHSRP